MLYSVKGPLGGRDVYEGNYSFHAVHVLNSASSSGSKTLAQGVGADIVTGVFDFSTHYDPSILVFRSIYAYVIKGIMSQGVPDPFAAPFSIKKNMKTYSEHQTGRSIIDFSRVEEKDSILITFEGVDYVLHVISITDYDLDFKITSDMKYAHKFVYISVKKDVEKKEQAGSVLGILNPHDIVNAYHLYLTSDSIDQKVSALAKALAWNQNAVRVFIASKGVTDEIRKKWDKITKIRQRAGHEATSIFEKETSLRMAIKMMETIIDPSLKVLTLEETERTPADVPVLLAKYPANSPSLYKPPTPKVNPRTSQSSRMSYGGFTPRRARSSTFSTTFTTAQTHPPPTQPPPTQSYNYTSTSTSAQSSIKPPDPELHRIKDIFIRILGPKARVRYSKARISITVKGTAFSSAPVLAMFSKSSKIQLMCKVGDQMGWTAVDSQGTPCINIRKPVSDAAIEAMARDLENIIM